MIIIGINKTNNINNDNNIMITSGIITLIYGRRTVQVPTASIYKRARWCPPVAPPALERRSRELTLSVRLHDKLGGDLSISRWRLHAILIEVL
jgi:hypothetical protein